jgi:hypothetical protein
MSASENGPENSPENRGWKPGKDDVWGEDHEAYAK